jgi:hypothetical protein
MEAQFINVHEKLIDEYLNSHPEATWEAAYEITTDEACERCIAEVFDLAETAKTRARRWQGDSNSLS